MPTNNKIKISTKFKRRYISLKINTMPFQKWISEDKHIAPSVPLYLLGATRPSGITVPIGGITVPNHHKPT
jgi:hypothetical protein